MKPTLSLFLLTILMIACRPTDAVHLATATPAPASATVPPPEPSPTTFVLPESIPSPSATALPSNTPAETAATSPSAVTTVIIPTIEATLADQTPTVSAETSCGWQWARQPLEELSAQLTQALKDASLPVESARAEAYGENCLGSDGVTVVRFAPMETDYYITLSASDLRDETMLGNLITGVISVLNKFPVGSTPGPKAGYVSLTFKAADSDLRLWFIRTQAENAIAQGLTGAELFAAIQIKP